MMARVDLAERTERVAGDDWRDEARQSLEAAADALLAELGDEVRVYSEQALSRKMRIEAGRMAEVEETATPEVVIDFLLRRQIELLTDSARLNKLEASVLGLAIQGWKPFEIAERFGLALDTVCRVLRIARRKISKVSSPYDGLYRVYWQEVHRYVYRKHRTPTE